MTLEALSGSATIMQSAALLVPGYLWLTAERWLSPQHRLAKEEKILRYIVYALINYAIWYTVILSTLLSAALMMRPSFWDVCLWIFVLILSPLALGIFTGILRRSKRVGAWLQKVGLPIPFTLETGWDQAFFRENSCLVRVLMKDGCERIGVYGCDSLVSPLPDSRDIFLEKLYEEDEHGDLQPKAMSLGMWIAEAEIRHLELYEIRSIDNGEQEE